MRNALWFIVVLIAAPVMHAGSLNAVEQHIALKAEESAQAQFKLLEQLVNINSGSTNLPGINKVGALLQAEFDALGFSTHWVQPPASMRRAGTLIAERTGDKGNHLLLIGHLDTVFPAHSPFQTLTRQGNLAKGPGVVDDKGGDVVLLFALKALEAAHALDGLRITVVLTGDEEDSGKPTSLSRLPLVEAARHSDIALDFECAITKNTATIARRGISMWTLTAQGIEAHSAGIFTPAVGSGAIFELARILNTLRLDLASQKYLSFNPGVILGGTRVSYDSDTAQGSAQGEENVVAKTAVATGDIRFLTAAQEREARLAMHRIVANHLPRTSAKIQFQNGIPAMPPTQSNLDLLTTYSAVSEDLGLGTVHKVSPVLRGAGDISHIANIVRANLAGLGPLGKGTHSTQETLYVDSLVMQTKRAAVFIYRLGQAKGLHLSPTN